MLSLCHSVQPDRPLSKLQEVFLWSHFNAYHHPRILLGFMSDLQHLAAVCVAQY